MPYALIFALFAVGCGQAPADRPEPALPGSWTGLCQRLDQCSCTAWEAPSGCAIELEQGYEQGMATARSLGLSEEAIAERAMTPEQLADIANSSCSQICGEFEGFVRAKRR